MISANPPLASLSHQGRLYEVFRHPLLAETLTLGALDLPSRAGDDATTPAWSVDLPTLDHFAVETRLSMEGQWLRVEAGGMHVKDSSFRSFVWVYRLDGQLVSVA